MGVTLLALVVHTSTPPETESLIAALAWPPERVEAALAQASADRVPITDVRSRSGVVGAVPGKARQTFWSKV